jgi:hypothetical protein
MKNKIKPNLTELATLVNRIVLLEESEEFQQIVQLFSKVSDFAARFHGNHFREGVLAIALSRNLTNIGPLAKLVSNVVGAETACNALQHALPGLAYPEKKPTTSKTVKQSPKLTMKYLSEVTGLSITSLTLAANAANAKRPGRGKHGQPLERADVLKIAQQRAKSPRLKFGETQGWNDVLRSQGLPALDQLQRETSENEIKEQPFKKG